MTTEEYDGNELDCYEPVAARTVGGTIHLEMDGIMNEDQTTFWNVYVPAQWDQGQRLVLLSEEQFEFIGTLLAGELMNDEQHSPLRADQWNIIQTLAGKAGPWSGAKAPVFCPECLTYLIPLGDKHFICNDCGVTLDEFMEEVIIFEDDDWIEIDPMTQEWDDALGIVRDDDMKIIDLPDHLKPLFEVNIFGDWVLKYDEEVRQAYEDYGGPNHSNHPDHPDNCPSCGGSKVDGKCVWGDFEPCERCDGTGSWPSDDGDGVVECSYCNGTGRSQDE